MFDPLARMTPTPQTPGLGGSKQGAHPRFSLRRGLQIFPNHDISRAHQR
jgi:hypothetical protein